SWCDDIHRSSSNDYQRYCRSFCFKKWVIDYFSGAFGGNYLEFNYLYFGIPSSSSHALIGSIAGAAIMEAGFDILNYSGFIKIIQALIFSPLIAFVIGFIVYSVFKVVFKNNNLSKTN